MDCDRIARWYRTCEFLAFGNRLQAHRIAFLTAVQGRRHALVLGDGNGRFVERLAQCNSALRIDLVDVSPRMIELTAARLGKFPASGETRVRLIVGDARTINFPAKSYDLIATHFFLDCFTEADLIGIVRKVAIRCPPGALWLVSDFNQPENGWRALHARAWLATMYWFFRRLTGLKTRRLPNYRSILRAAGFECLGRETSMGQLICSELWQLPS